jgi:hypothetical protein
MSRNRSRGSRSRFGSGWGFCARSPGLWFTGDARGVCFGAWLSFVCCWIALRNDAVRRFSSPKICFEKIAQHVLLVVLPSRQARCHWLRVLPPAALRHLQAARAAERSQARRCGSYRGEGRSAVS